MENEMGFVGYVMNSSCAREIYIVSFGDLFEFGLGFFFGVRVLVGMPFHGEFAISFLQIVIFSAPIHLKNLVIIDPHCSSSSSLIRSSLFST